VHATQIEGARRGQAPGHYREPRIRRPGPGKLGYQARTSGALGSRAFVHTARRTRATFRSTSPAIASGSCVAASESDLLGSG
jgi:hypothetical protein